MLQDRNSKKGHRQVAYFVTDHFCLCFMQEEDESDEGIVQCLSITSNASTYANLKCCIFVHMTRNVFILESYNSLCSDYCGVIFLKNILRDCSFSFET